mmetsp:Transcript_59787/g.138280  ORF Transcript_59787/g.138280 Transcript_59787/m.138280 type:complete len:179 (-) Transcript_59787:43-579(-)
MANRFSAPGAECVATNTSGRCGFDTRCRSIPRHSSQPILMNTTRHWHEEYDPIEGFTKAQIGCKPDLASRRDQAWQRKRPELFYQSHHHLQLIRQSRAPVSVQRNRSEPKAATTHSLSVLAMASSGSSHFQKDMLDDVRDWRPTSADLKSNQYRKFLPAKPDSQRSSLRGAGNAVAGR